MEKEEQLDDFDDLLAQIGVDGPEYLTQEEWTGITGVEFDGHEDWRGHVSGSAGQDELDAFMTRVSELGHVGRGTMHAFAEGPSTWRLLFWMDDRYNVAKGSFTDFAQSILARAWRGYYGGLRRGRSKDLVEEMHDQRLRDGALMSERCWIALDAHWRRRLPQILRNKKWYVPGMTSAELIDELVLTLFEELKGKGGKKFARHEQRAATPASYLCMRRAKDSLRKRRKFHEVVGDPSAQLVPPTKTPEALYLHAERHDLIRKEYASAKADANLPTKRWLDGVERFLASLDQVDEGARRRRERSINILKKGNPAKIAGLIKREGSGAHKALKKIRKEMERRGMRELLDADGEE